MHPATDEIAGRQRPARFGKHVDSDRREMNEDDRAQDGLQRGRQRS
jgi:hypothetical protein